MGLKRVPIIEKPRKIKKKKECIKCWKNLELSFFRKRSEICYRCEQSINRDYGKFLEEVTKQAWELNALKEAKPCIDCENYYPYYVMEFVPDLAKPIEERDLICSNCSLIRDYNQRQRRYELKKNIS